MPERLELDTTRSAEEDWEAWMKWDVTVDARSSENSPPFQYVSGSLGSTSPSELESLPSIQFSPVYQLPTTKKRKADATPTGRQPRGKKISHNVIEKRYRSNLNDKIAKLRDSVPELRSAQGAVKKTQKSDSEGSGDEGAGGLKFNKATVLVKATEYIQQLERQNTRLMAELSTLRNRSNGHNPTYMYAGSSANTATSTAVHSTPATAVGSSNAEEPAGLIKVPEDIRRLRDEVPPQPHYAPASSAPTPAEDSTAPLEVVGLIPISEDFRRFRAEAAATASTAHYAPPSTALRQLHSVYTNSGLEEEDDGRTSRWAKSRAMSRVLIGSLAGLMVMEGFSEREEDSPQLRKRGLFALPTDLVTESRGFRDPIRRRIIAFAASPRAGQLLPVLLFASIVFVIASAMFVFLGSERRKTGGERYDASSVLDHVEVEAEPETEPTAASHIVQTSSKADSDNDVVAASSLSGFREYAACAAIEVIDWLGFEWWRRQCQDEEAASRPVRRIRGYRRRWRAYSNMLPTLFEQPEDTSLG